MPRRTSNNFRTTTRVGMSVNKTSNKVFKDPDVWDPPPPLDKRPPQNNVKRTSKNISQNHTYNGRTKPGGKKGVDANGKKSFLL
jgi:hypothetical protein